MPRDYHLEKEISDSMAIYSTKLEWDDDFYDIDVTKESKRIKVMWAFPVRWVRFRFFLKDIKIFDTWANYSKNKALADIWDKTAEVIDRFLNLPDHGVMRRKWLKTAYLEVNENGQWVDIFNNFHKNNIKVKMQRTTVLDVVFNRSHRPSKAVDLPRDYQLEKDITGAFAEYSTTFEWDEGLYTIDVTKGVKRVKVNWAYDVHEVYFDFFENDKKIYEDWADFYSGETTSEIFNFVMFLVKRFINLPSRVFTQGKLLKTTDLAVNESGHWVNLYDNFTQK